MVVSTTDAPPQNLQTVQHRLIAGGSQLTETPRALSGALRRIATALRLLAIELEALGHGISGNRVQISKRMATVLTLKNEHMNV